MAEQEHYSLRWNNHQNHILRAFDALLQTKTLVDVTLVCAETSIRAHKVVLSACSPFFQNVFSETPCKHPVIVLKDFHGWVVQAIVDFMYRGEISVPQERLQILIQAGESLQVRGLVDHPIGDNLPTSVESLDDFMDTSLVSGDSLHLTNYEDSPTMVPQASSTLNNGGSTSGGGSSKHMRPHSIFGGENERSGAGGLGSSTSTGNTHHAADNSRENCTSPIPRRKQARPRRRSGEGGPHDLTSKPSSPVPQLGASGSTTNDDNDGVADRVSAEDLIKIKNVTLPAMLAARAKTDMGGGDEDDDDDDDENEDNDDEPDDIDANGHGASHRNPLMDMDEPDDQDDHEPDNDDDAENEQEDNDHDNDAIEPDDSHFDDNDSRDGPENLCIKNAMNNNSEIISNNNNNNNKNKSSGNSNSSNTNSNADNRVALSLKDIRHLNRPSMQCRQNPFSPSGSHLDFAAAAAAAAAAHHHQQQLEHQQRHQQEHEQKQQHQHQREREHREHRDHREHREQREQREHREHREHRRERNRERDRDRDHSQHQKHMPDSLNNHPAFLPHPSDDLKREAMERLESESPYMDHIDLSLAAAAAAAAAAHHHHNASGNMHHPNSRPHDMENSRHKEFTPSSPMSLPSHFNPREGPQHPPSPLQFPGMPPGLGLTPPHPMFGLDSPLGLFPPGMDPGKLYNPLMDMSDPRGMHPHPHGPFLKKKSKLGRPKGQHSAPRGGPPRSWTNAELTEALHHVWNKKMTTSQASRLFGIPYNSLLMYVRGKYGKSLNLEQLRKGCISGPPIELLTMGLAAHSGKSRGGKDHKEMEDLHVGPESGRASGSGGSLKRSASSEPDLLSNPAAMFNPFPPNFYSDFPPGFPGLPLSMLNLLPPDRHPPGMHHMGIDEDCKSDRSKQSLEDEYPMGQPLTLNRDDRRELMQENGRD